MTGYLEGHPLLDLNFMEDSAGGPDCSVALHPGSDRMVLLQMDSRCVLLNGLTHMQDLHGGCLRIWLLFRTKMLSYAPALLLPLAALDILLAGYLWIHLS